MGETLVCVLCRQAWDVTEGDHCILCGGVGRPADSVDLGKPISLPIHPVRRRKANTGSIRLTISKDQRFPLLLILNEEIARVTGIPKNCRADNDDAMLATAQDLLRRLTREKPIRKPPPLP